MRKMSVVVILAITGCATNTGILPASDGNYTVMRQGTSFLVSTAELKTQAIKEATDYCESRKRPLKVVHVKEIPAGAFGRWPEAEILFTCQ
jgi:hypothetical protein